MKPDRLTELSWRYPIYTLIIWIIVCIPVVLIMPDMLDVPAVTVYRFWVFICILWYVGGVYWLTNQKG